MDTLLRPRGLNALDDQIERLANQLNSTNPVDKDYTTIANNLAVLCEAREKKNDRVISNEALLAAAVNIIGILAVLNFEKAGIITSKAFNLISWKK